jgi:hypothetical protein
MGRLGAAGRKCHSGVILVLEHRRKRPHVSLFYFPTRPGWHFGLSAKLADLHPQFDAYPEAQVRLYRRGAITKAARDWIAKDLETSRRSAQRRHCHPKPQPSLPNQTAISRRPRPARLSILAGACCG